MVIQLKLLSASYGRIPVTALITFVMPPESVMRNPVDRELFLSGLRLAAGDAD